MSLKRLDSFFLRIVKSRFYSEPGIRGAGKCNLWTERTCRCLSYTGGKPDGWVGFALETQMLTNDIGLQFMSSSLSDSFCEMRFYFSLWFLFRAEFQRRPNLTKAHFLGRGSFSQGKCNQLTRPRFTKPNRPMEPIKQMDIGEAFRD